MSRFSQNYVSSVSQEVEKILKDNNLVNKNKELEIKAVLREFYFSTQRAIKQTQTENCEFSIFDYYQVQSNLVSKFQSFSSLSLNDWNKIIFDNCSFKEILCK